MIRAVESHRKIAAVKSLVAKATHQKIVILNGAKLVLAELKDL
jgi:hypothetical protein